MSRLDFHGDVSRQQLAAISRTYSIPEFVKQAAVEDLELPEKRGSYADPINRQFACHNKAATMMSVFYFLENQDSMSHQSRKLVGDHLTKFADYWGIRPELEAAANRRKTASDAGEDVSLIDSDFALVKVAEEGGTTRQYPLRNALEVKAAARWFVDNLPALRHELTFSDRQLVATRILDKAADFGASIGDSLETLERCAGLGSSRPTEIADALDGRRVFLKRAGRANSAAMLEGLQVLSSQIRNRPAVFLDPATLSKIAETLDVVDRNMGLTGQYTDELPAPEEIAFKVTNTKLSAYQESVFETQTGSTYTREQLQKLSVANIRSTFGEDIAQEVSRGIRIDPVKLADVAATLPLPDAERLDRLLASVGEKPVKVAAFRIGIPNEVLMQIADAACGE